MNIVKSDGFLNTKTNIKHCTTVIFIYTIIYLIFFSPVFFSNNLLAPGDGYIYSVPAFYSPRTLWTNLLLSGFPAAADIQVQTWYPISLLFSLIPNSWNAFVLSAYILASSFAYGYVYTLTKSRLAALVSGIIYGMSGFMMAHLGHTMMIHTAVWIPLLIWALEKLRHHFSANWFAVGVCAVACSFIAGHPQIFVYGMGLSAAYSLVLGWSAPLGRWKYYKISVGVLVLGVALSAIQLIPSIELANLTPRSAMRFQDFVSYSLPIHQVVELIFPYLFGGSRNALYKLPYFGKWNLNELAGYIGLLPLLLSGLGFCTYDNKLIKNFWCGVALVTLLLTLGTATPLAQLMYHLPAYNKFRVPARHFIEMALAVSVLAGLGVNSMQKQLVSNRLLIKTVSISTGFIGVSLIGIFLLYGQISKKALDAGFRQLTFMPWLNPTLGIPLLIFVLSVATLVYWSKSTSSKFRGLCLLFILVIDLGSFGWFYEWQERSPSNNLLMPTVSTLHYKKVLNSSQQRMLPIVGGLSEVEAIPPNMSRLWGVPSASGYGPLLLSRISELLLMSPAGDVQGNLDDRNNRSLDIMSIRYIFTPKQLSVTDEKGVSWSKENMSISLGNGCGTEEPNSVNLQVPAQISSTAIGIVSSLGCSTGVDNNAEILRISITDTQGKVVTQKLLAGRDTSEWAYECSDVLPNMKHKKAPIFENFPITDGSSKTCQGHTYVSILPLEKVNDVRSINLKWLGSPGAIGIKKVSLINGETQESHPILTFSDLARWHHVEDINQTSVYENLRAMPRAWLVPEVVSAKSEEILNSIKSSMLPDGRVFNPSRVALVQDAFRFKAPDLDASAKAKVVSLSDAIVELRISSLLPAFLVLSDVYYPGWRATVDGKNTHIFQTDYVLRGVKVPAGNHIVRFEYKPLTFAIGTGISTAVLLLLAYLIVKNQIKKLTV